MVVQHNMQAANANRMLNVTTGQQAKSTEKLSSGYRINRAADDAAGLTISEKMRKQIKGLDRASTNAEDGVSAVQTAEGALTEVHSMLQRMNELATQASNGTNSESDRSAIQDEISQLTTEIDRVAETTKFNETYLLKGNTDGTTSDMKINAHDAGLKGVLTDNGDNATFELPKDLEKGDKVTIAGTEYTIGDKAGTSTTDGYNTYANVQNSVIGAGDSVTDTSGNTYTFVDKIANANDWNNGTKFTITDEQGNSKEYTIAANTDLTANEIKNTDAKELIAKELANPSHKVTMTAYNDGTTTKDVNAEVVSSLDSKERSSVAWAGKTVNVFKTETTANGGLNNADVKSVSIGGKDATITANRPVSSSDIADVVGSMKAGDQLKVGTKTLTIADKTDAKNGEYTVTDALKAINVNADDMDAVEFAIKSSNKDGIKMLASKGITNDATADTTPTLNGTNAVTVVGATSSDNNANTITKAEAYEKMAKELQTASSIGTDDGAEAKVTNHGNGKFTIEKGTASVTDSLSFSLHVGADADMTNKITVGIDSMSAAGLGIKGINVKDDSGIAATYAIDAIADAVSKVSSQRSSLGAVQNRLEHTISNVDNVVENTTSAESRIRDTDMASEMVNYSKNNILAQAGQSMLAQANQSNQGVLSLLQ